MSYKDFAERELKAAGWYDEDAFYGDAVPKAVMELLDVWEKQGHSGMSAGIVSNIFYKLANWDPLTSLQGTEDEWVLLDYGPDVKYQNIRDGRIFKEADGRCKFVDAIVFKEEDGLTFTTGALDLGKGKRGPSSSQYIKSFPFTPKTFYVDVISKRWKDKEETIEDPDGDWWTYEIKNPKQLEEIFEYYDETN